MLKTLSALVLTTIIGSGTVGTQLVHHWPTVVAADDSIGPLTGHRWLAVNTGVA